jgi:L-alanine-DL-glutamate epimerase-like enolase superfamily enzyme
MKIEAVTLRELHMPLVHFFETSFGRIYERRVTLVTIRCDGVEGWGECVADEGPYYSEECGCLGPGLRPAAGQGSREPYGQGSSRKRSLGS